MSKIAPFLKRWCLITTAIFGFGAMSAERLSRPAEARLTLLEGVPRDVLVTHHGRTSISFRIGAQKTDYSSDRPNYRRVAAAINDGEPLRVWGRATTHRSVFGIESDDFHIYKVSIGDVPIVTYAETIAHESSQTFVIRVITWCLFTGIFAYGMLPVLLRRRRTSLGDQDDTSGPGRVLDMLRAAEEGSLPVATGSPT